MESTWHRIDRPAEGYDPGAAWVNRGLWLPPHGRISVITSYTPSKGWHSAMVTMRPAPEDFEPTEQHGYHLSGTLCTDLFQAVTTPLYLASEEFAGPRLFPL
jgi:hypothetical protein